MLGRLMKGVGANIFDKLIVAGSQLAMVPVLAGSWGLQVYGLWVLLSTIPSFLAMGDLGFATAAGTKMTMAAARGDRLEVISVFQSALRVILASSALLLLAALAVAGLIPSEVLGSGQIVPVKEARVTLFLVLIYGIAVLQGSIFFAAFRAAGLFALGAFWNALIILVESSVLICAVLLGAGPSGAAAAWLVGRVLGIIGQNILVRHHIPWLKIGVRNGSMAEVRALLAPAGAVMLVPAAQALSLQGTAIALGAAAGPAAVPLFTTARTLSRIGLQLCWLLNSALMPEFSAAAARDDRRAMAVMVGGTIAASVFLVLPFALGFGLLGRTAIELWTGGVVHPAHSVIWAMAAVTLFGGFWYPLSNLILALNRHGSYAGWYLALAVASVPAAFVMSESLGATGAALALLGLDFSMLIVISLLARRLLVTGSELRGTSSFIARRILSVIGRRQTRIFPSRHDGPSRQ